MQISDELKDLVVRLKGALALAETLSLGFVAISISSALDHIEQATGLQIHSSSDD